MIEPGTRFGRLTVLGFSHRKKVGKYYRYYYKCRCDCGKEKNILGRNLKGKTKSCGCLHAELLSKNKKENTYDIIGDVVIGKTQEGDTFEFDKEDYNKVVNSGFYWFIEDGYVRGRKRINKTRKRVHLHRLVMDAKGRQIVDHKDRDRKNNKKSNLRFCTKSQNAMNQEKIMGVYYCKKSKKWHALITANKKNIFIGSYDNYDDALDARIKAEKKYFKEFAPHREEVDDPVTL